MTALKAFWISSLSVAAKSTSQPSSFNLGSNVITFDFNSFPSFPFLLLHFHLFLSLSTLASRVSTAWNLRGELISHMTSGNPPAAQRRAVVLHFVSAGAYCRGLSSPTKPVSGRMIGLFRSTARQGSSILDLSRPPLGMRITLTKLVLLQDTFLWSVMIFVV